MIASHRSEKIIPDEILQKWQLAVNTLAGLFQVPVALITRAHPKQLEFLVSSDSQGNPYQAGKREALNGGLFCETVMRDHRMLHIGNTLESQEWNQNLEVSYGMTSYLGTPLYWPDHSIFGTICILNQQPIDDSPLLFSLMHQFGDLVESELKIMQESEDRKRYQKLLEGKMGELVEFNKELLRKERRISELKKRLETFEGQKQQSFLCI